MSRPETPGLSVDIIIQMADRQEPAIILIERRNPPHGWALPGGFVDPGERLETAAIREAREETGLDVSLTRLLGCYSAPDRDPRGHTVSAVYIATARGRPVAQDDAAALALFTHDEFPTGLAFDHNRILDDYLNYLATGEVAPLRPD